MHQKLELQKTKKRKIAEESSFDGNDDDADVTVGASTRNTHISQVPKQSILTEFSTRRLTADQKWDIDDCLTKFIVTSGIPFQTLENYYFIEFLQKLCPSYDPPSRKQFVTKYLPRLHNQWWAGLTDSMVGRENMTLALDVWTTRAHEYV
ncbi:hypothetical protein BKA69DRAFT_922188 [Paraphysoderma sedebokerense]|nr:hypothetical protein BKA69DRAFT_922188 [Paraphysoderma sedebokerense]